MSGGSNNIQDGKSSTWGSLCIRSSDAVLSGKPASSFHPFVPRVIRAFREAYPLVTVRLEERFGWELTEMVRREQLDVALIRTLPPEDSQGIVVSALLEEPMLIALPAAHALAGKSSRDKALLLKQLARE